MASTIVITGNPVEGLKFYGRFTDEAKAIEFAEAHLDSGDWWIAPLRAHPKEEAANPLYLDSSEPKSIPVAVPGTNTYSSVADQGFLQPSPLGFQEYYSAGTQDTVMMAPTPAHPRSVSLAELEWRRMRDRTLADLSDMQLHPRNNR